MILHTTHRELAHLLAPSEQQRQTQEEQSLLEIPEQSWAGGGELHGGAAQKLLHGLSAPDQFAAADGAGFIDERADLDRFVRGEEVEIKGARCTRRGLMAKETGVSHCLHLAVRPLAKSGRPQLRIS